MEDVDTLLYNLENDPDDLNNMDEIVNINNILNMTNTLQGTRDSKILSLAFHNDDFYLPPLLTEKERKELQQYKKMAIDLEKTQKINFIQNNKFKSKIPIRKTPITIKQIDSDLDSFSDTTYVAIDKCSSIQSVDDLDAIEKNIELNMKCNDTFDKSDTEDGIIKNEKLSSFDFDSINNVIKDISKDSKFQVTNSCITSMNTYKSENDSDSDIDLPVPSDSYTRTNIDSCFKINELDKNETFIMNQQKIYFNDMKIELSKKHKRQLDALIKEQGQQRNILFNYLKFSDDSKLNTSTCPVPEHLVMKKDSLVDIPNLENMINVHEQTMDNIDINMELNPQTLSVESAKCLNSLKNFKYKNIYNNVTHCRPNIDTFLANPDIQQKLHRLPSLVRGYLDRRIWTSDTIQNLIKTHRDALMLLSKLYNDNSEKSSEKFNLQRRLIVQVGSVRLEMCDIFVASTIADKMRLISMIRKKKQDLKFRNIVAKKLIKPRLSSATIKVLERKKAKMAVTQETKMNHSNFHIPIQPLEFKKLV